VGVTLQFLGYAGYLITTHEDKRILIDPYLDANPVAPFRSGDLERVDLVLVTHNAYDHFGDTPAILRRHRCPVVCAKDVAHTLTEVHGIDAELIRTTIWGLEMEVAGIVLHPVESHHWSFTVTPRGELLSGPALGYVVEAGPDVRIYHPGDSAISYDMKLWGELYRPTVGLMVVAVPEGSIPHEECYRSGEMTLHEALLASQWLGLDHIVASHYVRPENPSVQAFVRLATMTAEAGGPSPKVTVLRAGEVIDL
jgi:L-ascorbate metabolism protein UlaG (beta-lactamase superfamily)